MWVDNIRIGLKGEKLRGHLWYETGYEDNLGVHLFMNTAMNIQILQKEVKYFTSWVNTFLKEFFSPWKEYCTWELISADVYWNFRPGVSQKKLKHAKTILCDISEVG